MDYDRIAGDVVRDASSGRPLPTLDEGRRALVDSVARDLGWDGRLAAAFAAALLDGVGMHPEADMLKSTADHADDGMPSEGSQRVTLMGASDAALAGIWRSSFHDAPQPDDRRETIDRIIGHRRDVDDGAMGGAM